MPKRKIEFTEKQIIGMVAGALLLYVITRNVLLGLAGGLVGLIMSYVI